MHESSKSVFHKIKDSRYATRYIVGDGIDIGAGEDSIGQYYEFFPLMTSCRGWGPARRRRSADGERRRRHLRLRPFLALLWSTCATPRKRWRTGCASSSRAATWSA
ncbi:hypothetical protein ACRAWD_01365 [Caulobacter segnis]